MRILFLSAWYPYPPTNGSKLRIYNLLRGLSRSHEVTLVTFADRVPPSPPPELAALCRAVHVVAERPYNPTSHRSLLGFFSLTPRSLVDTFVPEMEQVIRREVERGQYDLVIASQWSTAVYLANLQGTPAIFEELELGILEARKATASSTLRRWRHQLTLLKLQYYLRRVLPRFVACTVVSNEEAALLRRMVPDYRRVAVVPNAVSLSDYRSVDVTPCPNTLIFAGSFRYFANHDAMDWFLRDVYPLIRARVPEARLIITGDHANLPLPPSENVTLTGFVDDVRPLVASAWASLAPLRLGGGTRLKILEAMALRSPVIATSKGAEGLAARHGEHLLVADSPEAYANAVVRVLAEPDLRNRLAEGGYRLVRENYDWDVVLPNFLELTEGVVSPAPP